RHPLVQVLGGRYIEHIVGPGHGHAAGLLGHEGDRVTLVQQAQLATRPLTGGRVQVDAPRKEISVIVGRQRAYVASSVAPLLAGSKEGEARYAVAGGVHQHHAGAVEDVARRHLRPAALHKVFGPRRPTVAAHAPVNAENSARAHVEI
nr:hypothetical protein [Tanacetum cinerariifolium]